MITTARRCRGRLAPLLALLTTTAATPVDYAADHRAEVDGERAAAVCRDVGGHWTPLGAVGVIIERDDHGQQAADSREGPQFHNQFQGHFLFSAFHVAGRWPARVEHVGITNLSAPLGSAGHGTKLISQGQASGM